MKRFFLIGAVLIALQLMVCQTSEAQNFSVEIFSVDASGAGFPPPDDILAPGPFPVLFGGTGLEVNGFSYGRSTVFDTPRFLDFSVDAGSTGIGGSGSGVDIEFTAGGPGEQNYDVYRSGLMGTNIQIHDGNGLGPGGTVAPLGMFEPQVSFINATGVDGYDNRISPGPTIYWTWDSSIGPGPTPSGADILISPTVGPPYTTVPGLYAPDFALGLGPGDNIDALEIWDTGVMPGIFDAGDFVLFSLDPFSPSLGVFGATPADILLATSVGTGVFIPEGALGLAPGDNVTALSVIPEPSSALICLVAIGLAAAKRRRRI